jgi:predicted  nucleic acid-binding Zn-ribbon protein
VRLSGRTSNSRHGSEEDALSEQLELLCRLSEIDDELSELLLEHEELPEQVSELEQQKTSILQAVADRQQAFDDAVSARKHAERDLEDLTIKLKDLEAKRLQIKTNEEYAALLLEIEHTRTAISEAEDTILKGLETAEEEASAIEKAKAEADSAARILEEKISALKMELGRVDDEVAVKRDERLRIATRVDKPLLGKYERILESKGDTAMACVAGGVCSGCRIKLPPQMVIEVRRADRFIECQSCGRILYWESEADVG